MNALTLLIIEDEDIFRRMTARHLERTGLYRVLQATGVQEAVKIVENKELFLALVITDVVLKDGYGTEAVQHIRKERASLPAVFMSGYPRDIVIQRGLIAPGDTFIDKSLVSTQLPSLLRDLTSPITAARPFL